MTATSARHLGALSGLRTWTARQRLRSRDVNKSWSKRVSNFSRVRKL